MLGTLALCLESLEEPSLAQMQQRLKRCEKSEQEKCIKLQTATDCRTAELHLELNSGMLGECVRVTVRG